MAAPVVTGTTSNAKTTGAQASLTFSHTSDGNPLYIAVALFSSARTVVSLTFGGVPLYLAGRTAAGGWGHEWWFLPAPAASTANLVITLDSGGTTWIAAVGRNVSGVDLDGVFRNLTSANANNTAPSVVVTSAVGDLVLDLVSSDANNQVFTVGAGQTAQATQNSVATTDVKVAASSEAGAASVTMSWTLSVSDSWCISGLSLPADGTVPSLAARVTQDVTEILSVPATTAGRVTQRVVEVLAATAAATARVTQRVVEVLAANQTPLSAAPTIALGVVATLSGGAAATPLAATAAVQVSTTATLSQPTTVLATVAGVQISVTLATLGEVGASGLYATQLPVEILDQRAAATTLTQLVIETLDVLPRAPIVVTQAVAEILPHLAAREAEVTQLLAELVLILRPLPPSACSTDFPVDDASGGGACAAPRLP